MTLPIAAQSPSTVRPDALAAGPRAPDRVFYATGMLLDAQDFGDEQLYHRGRLARALAYLHGHGTVAGLRVRWKAGTPEAEEEVEVEPGMAIDRLGRIIEVPRVACTRLDRWFRAQAPGDLDPALKPALGGIVADVFVRYVACERGKTPAFAAGPFDALDAVQPSRLRDGYELSLVLRKEDEPPLPEPQWPDLAAVADPDERRTRLQDAIFAAWREGEPTWTDDGLARLREHTPLQDPTALFLARLLLPATRPDASDRLVRTEGAEVQIDNRARSFVYAPGALARLAGL